MTRARLLRRLTGATRRAATRAFLVVTALVILLGMTKGSTRFFYCPVTHLAFAAPPCGGNAREDAAALEEALDETVDAPALRIADCCEERWRAGVPVASTPHVVAPEIATAPFLAFLPPPPRGMEIASAAMPFEVSASVRAGPEPKAARERRAELMVFLE